MDQGTRPSNVPLTSAQIQAAADPQYMRIDGANRPPHVFNNALMNASFEWWQRGTGTFTASGAGVGVYGPDRWRPYNIGANGSMSVSRIALAIADQPSLSRYAAQLTTTGHTAAGDGAFFQQPIEGVDTFAGKRVVVTGKVRQIGATGAKLFVELAQLFGTGGSAEVDIQSDLNGGQLPLTTSFQSFGFTFNVPSMSGKVIGTADLLALNIWLSAGSTFNARTNNLGLQSATIQLVDIEVKELRAGYGDQYPQFERLPKFLDLQNCLRYYEKSYDLGVAPGTVGADPSGSAISVAQNAVDLNDGGRTVFQATKRAIPSITIYAPLTGAVGYTNSTGSTNYGGLCWWPGVRGFNLRNSSAQNWGAGQFVCWHWVAFAEF